MKKYLNYFVVSYVIVTCNPLFSLQYSTAFSFLSSLSQTVVSSKTEHKEIKRICRKLRKLYHPDKSLNKSLDEQEESKKILIDINNACKAIDENQHVFSSYSEFANNQSPEILTQVFEEFKKQLNVQKAQEMAKHIQEPAKHESDWFAYTKNSWSLLDAIALVVTILVLNRLYDMPVGN